MTLNSQIMNNWHSLKDIELSRMELIAIQGGSGPITEAVEWYFKTLGSFYRGVWDGRVGNEPAV